jgi:hypothetical protein
MTTGHGGRVVGVSFAGENVLGIRENKPLLFAGFAPNRGGFLEQNKSIRRDTSGSGNQKKRALKNPEPTSLAPQGRLTKFPSLDGLDG